MNMYLLNRVVEEFERGIRLLESLSDEIYNNADNDVGSIGAHFRHNLDFANNFLSGLTEGRIDYGSRERDLRVERDRVYAKEKFLFLIRRLESLQGSALDGMVHVRSEIDEEEWHVSSGNRELEFLHSHTVHHYALIAEKLKGAGIELSADFGVAPSTLKFWASRKSKNKVA